MIRWPAFATIFKATEPWSVEAILLGFLTGLAVRGARVSEQDIDHHLGLARALMEQAFTREENPGAAGASLR